MRRKLFIFVFVLLLAPYFVIQQLTAFSSVPPSGKTGSPGDGLSCNQCHGGGENLQLETGISIDIPESGYVPGETYNITIGEGLSRIGKSKYGFQLSPQNSSGDLIGELIAGDGTTLLTNGKYVAHNGAVNTSNPSWDVQWTAPAEGTGEVDFYLAVVAANNNGDSSGDDVLLVNKTIQESQTLSVNENISDEIKISSLIGRIEITGKVSAIEIITINGSILTNIENLKGEFISLNTSNWKKGVYFVRVYKLDKPIVKKIIIQ